MKSKTMKIGLFLLLTATSFVNVANAQKGGKKANEKEILYQNFEETKKEIVAELGKIEFVGGLSSPTEIKADLFMTEAGGDLGVPLNIYGTEVPSADGGGKNYAGAAFAIKTTGSLWVWGVGNSTGRFGRNVVDTSDILSPVQVGTLTNWSMASAHNYQAGAIKTDGTLWTWGSNSGGTLGDGTAINRSSPVQIGSGTTWNTIRVSDGGMMALNNVVVGVPGYFTY